MRRLFWLLLPASALAADMGSKAWILSFLHAGESYRVIDGFFNLSLTFNRGAIFGSLAWLPDGVRFGLFALAGLAALIYFGRLFLAPGTRTLDRVALGLILGGALGNGLDRLFRGHVVDLLDFYISKLDIVFIHVHDWHYWTFNLADSFILVGAVLYGFGLMRGPSVSQEPASTKS
jgi:signal peptidase II